MKTGLQLIAGVALCYLAAIARSQSVPLAFSGTFNASANVGPNLGTLQTVDQSTIQGLGLGMMSALQLVMEPCTLLYPHTHAQSEFSYVASGTPTVGVIYTENGTTKLYEQVNQPGGFNIVPPGQLHYIANNACTNTTIFAAFNSPTFDVYFYPLTESFLPLSVFQAAYNVSSSNTANTWQTTASMQNGVLTRLPPDCLAKCVSTASNSAAGAAGSAMDSPSIELSTTGAMYG